MARLALITALLFTTVVGFIFLTGFSGEDKGILPTGDSRGVSALSGEGTKMLSEEEIRAVVAERFPEAGILEVHLVADGGFEARLLFGNASYDVTLSSDGAITNIAAPSNVSATDVPPQEGATPATVSGTLVSKPRILNTAAVLLHNTASDCWLIINSKVYNVTSYLSEHPGGAASIIAYCGKEATAAFETKDKTPAKPHSSFASSLLEAYYVGFLGQVLSGAEASAKGGTSVSGESAQTVMTKPTTSASAPKEIPLPQFAVGDAVKTISVLNVRDGASIKQTILGKQEIGARGVIVSGPIFTNGYWWWEIDWQSIPDGWSAGDFLALTPTAVVPENIAPAPTPTPTTVPSAQTPSTGITAAEVAIHNTRTDCWVIFESRVYNVTSYISSHPGGASAITAYCGADLTAAFVAQGHSQNARSLFANYYVGDLSTSATSPTTTTPSSTTAPPSTDSLQPYRDAIYAKYPNANITKLQLEDNGNAEFKFSYNGKTYEGKMNAQYQITKIE